MEEWQVVLHDHHPAYISAETYHANVEKIAMNAQRLEHIYAELDEATGEVVLSVKWYGGHHTSLLSARRREEIKHDELSTIIDTLRKLHPETESPASRAKERHPRSWLPSKQASKAVLAPN